MPEVKGQIRLLFRTGVNHQSVCATRTFQLTNTRTKAGVKSQFKALENLIRFKDQNGDENRGNRRCADMDTAIPSLMGVPKPILEHVIFCHQEDSNWPLGERILLKKRFDDIFGSSRYTKALEAIDKQRKEITKEAKEKAHVLALVGKDRDAANELIKEKEKLESSLKMQRVRISDLDKIIETKERELSDIQRMESEQREKFLRIESISREIDRLKAVRTDLDEKIPKEECLIAENALREELACVESRISESSSELSSLKREFESLVRLRNEAAMKLRSLKNTQLESSNVVDLVRLKQQELLESVSIAKSSGFLPLEFEFESPAISIQKLQTMVLVKMEMNESILKMKKLEVEKSETETKENEGILSNLERDLFALNGQVSALQNRSKSLSLEINALAGSQDLLSLAPDQAVRELEEKLVQIDFKLQKTAIDRKLLLAGPVHAEDLKMDILEFISDSINVASLMHASPSDVLAHLDLKKIEIQSKLDSLTSMSQTQQNGEWEQVNEELSLAKQAMKIYAQMKSRTLADLKCGLCRHKIENACDFEAIFEKITKKLPEIISEYESKRQNLIPPSPQVSGSEEVRKCMQELISVEKCISRIQAFCQVLEKLKLNQEKDFTGDAIVKELEISELKLSSDRKNILTQIQNVKSAISLSNELELVAAKLIELQSVEVVAASCACRSQSDKVLCMKQNLSNLQESFRSDQIRLDSEVNSMRNAFHMIFQSSSQLESLKLKLTCNNSSIQSANLAQLEAEESTLSSKLNQVISGMSICEESKSEAESLLKSILKNLERAQIQSQFSSFIAQLYDLKSETSIKHVLPAPENIRDTISSMSLHVRTVRDERAKLSGESAQIENQVNELMKKLSSNTFKDIEEKHRQAFCIMENHNVLYKDVQRYHQALDRALMNYHVQKMNQINQVIQDLWGRIYKGTDIDYIAIRSDSESSDDPSEAAASSAIAKRSYNYRVVMVKGDVDLEMRGRCSAGQKVLASLIIRLALAESFCLSCGILALDEPTTNLDRSNIGGLAEALAELIESRREHRNFQLVIITHDESFVRMLGRLRACDNFHRVAKDQFGHSTISRAAIYELNTT